MGRGERLRQELKMPEMTITQTVTADDFRKAYGTFYSTYLLTRYRPWFGAVMVAFGVFLLNSQPEKAPVAVLFLLLGVYLFLAKQIYVARRLQHARRAGRLPAEMKVELSGTGAMKISSEGEHSELDLRRVHGCQVAPTGVLIYLRRNMFFLLKRDAIEQAGGLEALLSILAGAGLKRIA